MKDFIVTGHSANLWKRDNKVIVFGGECYNDNDKTNPYSNVTYAMSVEPKQKNSDIQELKTLGEKPSPRTGHCSALIKDKLYIFGANHTKHGDKSVLFSLDLTNNNWTMIKTNIWQKFLGGEDIIGISMFTNSKDTLYFTGGFIVTTIEMSNSQNRYNSEW